MALLLALVERPGQVCVKRELLDRVWPDVVVTEASLSVAVAELRTALEDDSSRPTYVETIPRRGYRLLARVEGGLQPRTPRPATSSFSLIGREVTIPLNSGVTVIGRDSSCDARIESHHVSRCHVTLEVDGERVFVEDLGSKNGTFVNGERVTARRQLRTGDRLRLGRYAATLQLVGGGTSTWTEMSAIAPIGETPG